MKIGSMMLLLEALELGGLMSNHLLKTDIRIQTASGHFLLLYAPLNSKTLTNCSK